MALLILTLVSAGAFLFYGYETLFGVRHRGEFERYGLSKLRVFVGSMQVLGALGALVGLVSAPVGAAATAGLTLMMMVGVVVRYRIHDAPRLMVPAATLAILNGTLLYVHLS